MTTNDDTLRPARGAPGQDAPLRALPPLLLASGIEDDLGAAW